MSKRAEQKRKREEKLVDYRAYCRSKLERGVDLQVWLELGTPYERALKGIAYREMKALIIRQRESK